MRRGREKKLGKFLGFTDELRKSAGKKKKKSGNIPRVDGRASKHFKICNDKLAARHYPARQPVRADGNSRVRVTVQEHALRERVPLLGIGVPGRDGDAVGLLVAVRRVCQRVDLTRGRRGVAGVDDRMNVATQGGA